MAHSVLRLLWTAGFFSCVLLELFQVFGSLAPVFELVLIAELLFGVWSGLAAGDGGGVHLL